MLASAIGLRKAGFYSAIYALIIFIATFSFAISSRNNILSHDEAIVTASAISIKSSPDRASTELFVLHEGTKVRVVSEMDNWAEVVIADGKKGWTEKGNIEKI
jgi:SH3-like domain-containing protein